MGFLKNIIRNAVSDGIRKGIRDAVSSAAEAGVESGEKAGSSLEQAAERLSRSAEAYAKALENSTAGLREWNEKLPGFPVWCFGGKDFSIDENYTSEEGTTYYFFNAAGAAYEDMCAYIKVLKADGFVQKYKDSDEVLYKDLGGEYLVFSSVEAFNDPDVMSVGMYRTKNKNDI